jgi:hypothetical protein
MPAEREREMGRGSTEKRSIKGMKKKKERKKEKV